MTKLDVLPGSRSVEHLATMLVDSEMPSGDADDSWTPSNTVRLS